MFQYSLLYKTKRSRSYATGVHNNLILIISIVFISTSHSGLFSDPEMPTFEVCPVNQTLNTIPGQSFAVAVWKHPSATDNSGDNPSVTCIPLSGSTFTIGETSVTCDAVDSSRNNNTCSFQIDVEGLLSCTVFIVNLVYSMTVTGLFTV